MATRVPADVQRAEVEDDLQRASELATKSIAANTRRAYRADIKDWTRYAETIGAQVVPADPVAIASYIGHMDRRALSRATIRRRCSAISHLHRERDLPSPLQNKKVKKVLEGLVRERNEPQEQKEPLTPKIMIAVLQDPKTSVRDRALLLFGFLTGMRRSEIVAMRWADLREKPEGILVHQRKSKTDQHGKGRDLSLPRHDNVLFCPVRALEAWKKLCKDKVLVFPFSSQTVADRVKRAALRTGHDPREFSGHSLRAGLATTATREGVPQAEWMLQTGHKSYDQALKYARVTDAFKNRAPHSALAAMEREAQKKKP